MMTKEHAASYLAGFYDGEGCVFFGVYKSGTIRTISCSNTDRALIDYVSFCLDELRIPHNIYLTDPLSRKMAARKEIWNIHIRGGEVGFRRFAKYVKLQSPNKVLKLNQILGSYPLTPERFDEEYKRDLNESITLGKAEVEKLSLTS